MGQCWGIMQPCISCFWRDVTRYGSLDEADYPTVLPAPEDSPSEVAEFSPIPDVTITPAPQEVPIENEGLLFEDPPYWTNLIVEDEEAEQQIPPALPSKKKSLKPPAQEEPREELLPEMCPAEETLPVCQGCQGLEQGSKVLSPETASEPSQAMQPPQQQDDPVIVIQQTDNTSTDMETSGLEEGTYVKLKPVASSQDVEAARDLARKLFSLQGFDRSQVAPYLQKNNEFSAMVAEEYLALFDFTGKSLDAALRSLMQELILTGETQERERVLDHFSKRFHNCNPRDFSSASAVHTLTCALMLLNTDLHGQNIGKSMTAQDFINNLEGMNDGGNFPRDLLKGLYHSIRQEKLEWAVSEEKLPNVLVPKQEINLPVRKKSNAFVDIPPPDPNAPVYKQGMLCRKVHADIDGKKTPWGKRGWKFFHTVLKGTLLYFLKDEYRADFSQPEEVIRIHHALAEKASEYTKRPHVFRLQTSDWRVFLFQAQNPEEMTSWISRINLVAAMFSSPPFPAAVGSQRKFFRPILPSAPSKLDLEEQLQTHETLMDRFTDDLTEHQRNLPDPKSKTRDWEDYHIREEYLRYEKLRYETYVKLLAVRLEKGCDNLEDFESRLVEPDGAQETSVLKRSYSSPSLNPESSPVSAKVKRNISERRTYRRIIPKRNKNLP
ncbi:PH and SEC7 domain-containing protein 4-like isoform X2 [Hyperolius riggenbachi]|uniref:PH and SEC7 domain-containing protein 4-like isoform X2 n=1 Tax=Hyperolius riggenbachi TaxID=752182 RepID=UPI0035A2C6DA